MTSLVQLDPHTELRRLLRQLPLPLLPDGENFGVMMDALEFAADSRQGVIAVGAGDCGKSVALAWAAQEFEAGEMESAAADPAYRPRRVVRLNASIPKTSLELLKAIYKAAFDTDPILRVRGVLKGPSELLRELALRLREEDVAAVILDDADAVSVAMLEHVTGLMAVATDDHPDRLHGATETLVDGAVLPQGVGVLVCGTARLEQNLVTGSEIGNAWKKTVHLRAIAAAAVPGVMMQLLETWRFAAEHLGPDAWAKVVKEKVSFGRPVPIGSLDALARLYVRRAVLIAQESGQLLQRTTEIPWDEDLLSQVRKELHVPYSAYTPSLDVADAA